MRNKSPHGQPRHHPDPFLQSCPRLQERNTPTKTPPMTGTVMALPVPFNMAVSDNAPGMEAGSVPCSKHLSASHNGRKIKASLGPKAGTPKLTTHRGPHVLRQGALSSMRKLACDLFGFLSIGKHANWPFLLRSRMSSLRTRNHIWIFVLPGVAEVADGIFHY